MFTSLTHAHCFYLYHVDSSRWHTQVIGPRIPASWLHHKKDDTFDDVCGNNLGVFFVIRPNPMLHFAPFLSTHFFPCLNPIFKNGSFLSVVALVSVTLLNLNPRASPEKRSILAPPPLPPRTATIDLPKCQERRGAKTKWSVF